MTVWMDRNEKHIHRDERPSELDAPINRRTFLKGLGISGVIAGLACERLPARKALPYLVPPDEVTPGVPVVYASTCAGCAGACGILVQTRDGRPIKIEGNPDHPLSSGGVCARGHAEIRGLYDAGRLRAPLRDGSTTTWNELDAAVRAELDTVRSSGKPLWVVTPKLVSPTARGTVRAFVDLVGGEHVELEVPDGPELAVAGAYHALDGRALSASPHLDRTDLLVTVGSDLLSTESTAVAHTAAYSRSRQRRVEGGSFLHVALEGSLTLTGAAADRRIPLTAYERLQVLHGVLGELTAHALDGPPLKTPALQAHVRKLADLLSAHKRHSLVVSGSTDVAEQILVALLNRVLHAEGHTLTLSERGPSLQSPAALNDALLSDALGGAIFVGVNPVEELPAGGKLRAAIEKLPFTVAITDRPHATATACKYVAAAHHALETWGDARVAANVLTVQQPTIRPLFDTRDAFENFLVWSEHDVLDYREHLRATWIRSLWPSSSDPELAWRKALASGGAAIDATQSLHVRLGERQVRLGWEATRPPRSHSGIPAPARAVLAGALARKPNRLEVDLIREVGLLEGGACANPWVRELPDPLTKVSWTACARIAPATAAAHAIEDGDRINVTAGKTTLQLPARIQPGQHPNVLAVPVGYGLTDGDGGDTSRNAYQLARWDAGRLRSHGLACTIAPSGTREDLPIVQPHPSTEGRPVVHQVHSPTEAVHAPHHPDDSLWEDYDYEVHWEMVIDLDKCTGCSACVLSCQAENNIAVVGPDEMGRHRDMHWLRIDRYFSGEEENPDVLFEPMLCAQCDNAPCETVCPVAATLHSADGLNQQVYNRCVGTRYCANNCPYKTRRFNWLDNRPSDPVERMALNPDVVFRDRGVMEKCTFCVQRIQRARIEAKSHGESVPANIQPACQQSCPAGAISFGDGNRSESGLAELKKAHRSFQVLAELGTRPSITYLARIRARSEQTHSKHEGEHE